MRQGLYLFTVLWTLASLSPTAQAAERRAGGATQTEAKRPARKALAAIELNEPLAFGQEFVEVTADGALRRRYHDRDYEKDLAFYMKEAKANAARRAPNVMRMTMVLCKDVRVTSPQFKDANGAPVEFIQHTTDKDFAEAPAAQKRFSDFVFACTRGEVQVKWETRAIDQTLRCETKGKTWILQPKALEDQLKTALGDIGKTDLMAFLCHGAFASDGRRLPLGAGGVAWTAWRYQNAKTFTVTSLSLDMLVHEWLHHIFDSTLQETEGLTLAIMHGSADLGYTKDDLGWPSYLDHYRDRIRYYYTRDMWRRWSMTEKHNTPHESFSGKAYAWVDVKDDCWFKLPRVSVEDLRKLTGLQSLTVDAPKGKGTTLLKVSPQEKLSSPRIDAIGLGEAALNNALNWSRESITVLRTPSGHWLFVKPDLVDVYVDMLSTAGKPGKPLPVYGYLAEGVKPLVIVRAPEDMSAPREEIDYFKRSVSTDAHR